MLRVLTGHFGTCIGYVVLGGTLGEIGNEMMMKVISGVSEPLSSRMSSKTFAFFSQVETMDIGIIVQACYVLGYGNGVFSA